MKIPIQAETIYNKLVAESVKLRPGDYPKKITHKEALNVVSESDINFLLKLQAMGYSIMFERKSRGGSHYIL